LQDLVNDSGQRVFVGVDEYDAPANAVLFSLDRAMFGRITNLFKSEFFRIIKDMVAQNIVVKYWLTGVLPAFRDGLSPLTAARVISGVREFHGLCGLTGAEVQTVAEAYLSRSLGPQELTEALHEVRQWYNGYRFCKTKTHPIDPLYNPQLVFTHLRGLAAREPIEPRDEIEAPHTASVLNAIPKDGDSSFFDVFTQASSSSLESEVRAQFTADDVQMRYPWVTQTLLYYFGVFTYAETSRFLTIPNRTMRRLVHFIAIS